MKETKEEEYGFNKIFFRRFLRLQPYIFLDRLNVLFALIILLFSALEQGIIYKVGMIPGQFIKCLVSRDESRFWHVLVLSLACVIIMAFVLSSKALISELLTVSWRRSLTRGLHFLYFYDKGFYYLELDNPDQRIVADVETLVSVYGEILSEIILSPFVISYYIYDSYRIRGSGPWGPLIILLFFLLGTAFNKILLGPVVKAGVIRTAKEGDFRFKHAEIRSWSESLAFFGPEGSIAEIRRGNSSLDLLCEAQRVLIRVTYRLNLSTNFFNYGASILSYLIVGIPVFNGFYGNISVDELSAKISESAFINIMLMSKFTRLVDLAKKVSRLASVTHRVAEFIEALALYRLRGNDDQNDDMANDEREPLLLKPAVWLEPLESPEIEGILVAKNMSIGPPKLNNKMLINDLNIFLARNENLLITGSSSSGKTSLLRIFRGLWTPKTGSFNIFSDSVLFLPQKAFFTNGSLRRQIMYPYDVVLSQTNSDSDIWILHHLYEFGLMDLYSRAGEDLDLDMTKNWSDILSPGEMQRLAFIRALYHSPEIIFLDEATSALSLDIEEKCYQKCIELKNTTLISVGHRESLKRYHQKELHLMGNSLGQYEIKDLTGQS